MAPISLALVATACRLTPWPKAHNAAPANLESEVFDRMEFTATQTLACSAENLSYEQKEGRHYFSGCKERLEVLVFPSNGGTALYPSPSYRFSKEIKCPMDNAKATRIDIKTFTVEGCDQRMTYVYSCDYGSSCTWIANYDSRKN